MAGPSDQDFPGFEDEDDEATVLTTSTPKHDAEPRAAAAAPTHPTFDDDDDDDATALSVPPDRSRPSHAGAPTFVDHAPSQDAAANENFPGFDDDDDDDEATVLSASAQQAAKVASARPAPSIADRPTPTSARDPAPARAAPTSAPTSAPASAPAPATAEAAPASASAEAAPAADAMAARAVDAEARPERNRTSVAEAEERDARQTEARQTEDPADAAEPSSGIRRAAKAPPPELPELDLAPLRALRKRAPTGAASAPVAVQSAATPPAMKDLSLRLPAIESITEATIANARERAAPDLVSPGFIVAAGAGPDHEEARALLSAKFESADVDVLLRAAASGLLDELAARTEVELHDALIDREARLRWEEANEDVADRKAEGESSVLGAWVKDPARRAQAEAALRLSVALAAVAARDRVEVEPALQAAWVEEVARQTESDAGQARARLGQDTSLQERVHDTLRHELTVLHVLRHARVTWGEVDATGGDRREVPTGDVGAVAVGGEGEELRSFAEIAQIDPKLIETAAATAWELYTAHEYKDARALFRGLAAMQPEDPDHLRGYALSSLADGDHTAALDALDRADAFLELVSAPDANRGELLALRATVLIKTEDKAEALQVALRARQLTPDDAPWAKDLEDGIEGLERSQRLARPPQPTEELDELLSEALTDVLAGGRSLGAAFGYSDDELMALHKDGVRLIQGGQLAQARRVFEGLVALDATVPLFHVSLATVCDLIGDVLMAEAAFEAAIGHASQVSNGDDLVAGAVLRRGLFRARYGAEGAQEDLIAALGSGLLNADEQRQCKETLDALAAGASASSNPGTGGGSAPSTDASLDPAAPRGPPTKR